MAGTVTVKGIEETRTDLLNASAAVHTPEGLGHAADVVADAARIIGPDRSGALSSGYEGEATNDLFGVTTNVYYGHMVEYGTKYQMAQWRVRTAFDRELPRIEADLDGTIEAAYHKEVTPL